MMQMKFWQGHSRRLKAQLARRLAEFSARARDGMAEIFNRMKGEKAESRNLKSET
jgi:VIT1/CCC1 family predicted Fe2+/Mn2+ transporter